MPHRCSGFFAPGLTRSTSTVLPISTSCSLRRKAPSAESSSSWQGNAIAPTRTWAAIPLTRRRWLRGCAFAIKPSAVPRYENAADPFRLHQGRVRPGGSGWAGVGSEVRQGRLADGEDVEADGVKGLVIEDVAPVEDEGGLLHRVEDGAVVERAVLVP